MPDRIDPAYLATAVEAVIHAGDLQMSRVGGRMRIEKKGIIDLVNAGADIVVDDIRYFAEPFYQDGIIAQAVDQAVDQGGEAVLHGGGQTGVEAALAAGQALHLESRDGDALDPEAGVHRLHLGLEETGDPPGVAAGQRQAHGDR